MAFEIFSGKGKLGEMLSQKSGNSGWTELLESDEIMESLTSVSDPRWQEAIRRCLVKQAAERATTAKELLEVLDGKHLVEQDPTTKDAPSLGGTEELTIQVDSYLPEIPESIHPNKGMDANPVMEKEAVTEIPSYSEEKSTIGANKIKIIAVSIFTLLVVTIFSIVYFSGEPVILGNTEIKKTTAEEQKKADEKKKKAEELRKAEEARKKAEDLKKADELRKAEETRKKTEDLKKADELRKAKIIDEIVSDIDGNRYKTVQIGNQLWMKENLRVSRYRNGDPIPANLNNATWSRTTSGAYAIYNNDAANNTTYGKLYNWYAVADPRGLCPAGWHVPSDGEWTTLEKYLGFLDAGGKLKAVSSLWESPNTGASNSSGFSALPGGCRVINGTFRDVGNEGSWWFSTDNSSTYAWLTNLYYYTRLSQQAEVDKQNGFSVRCLRD
jgi:uncharacterized protein (TIGR02145 family)